MANLSLDFRASLFCSPVKCNTLTKNGPLTAQVPDPSLEKLWRANLIFSQELPARLFDLQPSPLPRHHLISKNAKTDDTLKRLRTYEPITTCLSFEAQWRDHCALLSQRPQCSEPPLLVLRPSLLPQTSACSVAPSHLHHFAQPTTSPRHQA